MPVRKTLLRTDTGVRLHRVDEVQGDTVQATHYRLTTLRPAQPRLLADQGLAETAFLREVAASKLDPIAVQIAAARG